MNILISVNKTYVDKVQTMLLSLSLNVKEMVTVYLMNHSLDGQDVISLKEYLKEKCNFNLIEINVKKTSLDDLPIYLHFSIEAIYRLLAQFLLPKTVDRVLWLDADIIILNDITEFYYQDFEEKLLIVCADVNHDREDVHKIKQAMKISQEHTYFNSGVSLFNLTKLRAETTEEEIVEVCNRMKDKVMYVDQDILNYLYQFKVKYENPKKYNYQLTNDNFIEEKDLAEICILHYSGPRKPWDYKYINKTSKHYWNIKIKQGYILEYLKTMSFSLVYRGLKKLKRTIFK
mgnify:FL=1